MSPRGNALNVYAQLFWNCEQITHCTYKHGATAKYIWTIMYQEDNVGTAHSMQTTTLNMNDLKTYIYGGLCEAVQ